jgi:carboxypeptidase C (cathepsin A)
MLKIILSTLLIASLFSDEIKVASSIQMQEEPISYTITAGNGPVSYIAYTREGVNRPITFAFNGGPGSSSVWLHLGVFGPKRVLSTEEGQSLTPPYQIIDNQETILDITDLVFIDPPGTGFSTPPGEEQKDAYSLNGDIRLVGNFIRDYLIKEQRWNSPKYIAGESYGGMRAVGVAEYLQSEFGIYLNGLVLISPVVDYQTISFSPDNPLPFLLYIPTYAATAWHHGFYKSEKPLEEVVEAAKDFAYNNYAKAILDPKRFSLEELYPDLAEICGVSEEFLKTYKGHIYDAAFQSELLKRQGKVIGRFDSRITAHGHAFHPLQDPSCDGIEGIFSAAIHDYLQKELNIHTPYTAISMQINQNWDFQPNLFIGAPNLMNSLRSAVKKNPELKIFVGCGYFDLATPIATVEYSMNHADIPDNCLQTQYYRGGHMYYLTSKERVKFKKDLVQFYGN